LTPPRAPGLPNTSNDQKQTSKPAKQTKKIKGRLSHTLRAPGGEAGTIQWGKLKLSSETTGKRRVMGNGNFNGDMGGAGERAWKTHQLGGSVRDMKDGSYIQNLVKKKG